MLNSISTAVFLIVVTINSISFEHMSYVSSGLVIDLRPTHSKHVGEDASSEVDFVLPNVPVETKPV